MIHVLVVLDHYLPGYKAGGPVRSIANLVDSMSDEIQFSVLTRDRDLGDANPYSSVKVGEWNGVGNADVFYVGRGSSVAAAIREKRPDVVYLNSFFSSLSIRIILLRFLRLLPTSAIVLAPRGQFAEGAMRFSRRKKQAFLTVSRALRLYSGVVWHATNDAEAAEIERHSPARPVSISVAPPFASLDSGAHVEREPKRPGSLRAIFASRISPKKNLDGLIAILSGTSSSVNLDVFGPVDDSSYWAKCLQAADKLPPNVRMQYRGALPHDALQRELARADLFILPTYGENHGHAIVEALSAACPVLISDQTPWENLASAHAGWDLTLSDVSGFRKTIEQVAAMDDAEHRTWRDGARRHARQLQNRDKTAARYREMFNLAVGSRRDQESGHALKETS